MVFIIFLLGVTLFINVVVGGLAYLAICESQRSRHEAERCRLAVAEVLEQLVYIRQQTPFSPVFRADKPAPAEYFATIMGAALANYELRAA
jgi:hypothetical protein